MAGGQYRPLAVRDIERIFSTALDVLENIGIGESIPEILRYALPGGCTLGTDGRLRFPRSLVEDMMAVASHGFVRYGVDPAYDIEISGER
jgi:trimethylamine--corrinoid protein Co-methyltransferase